MDWLDTDCDWLKGNQSFFVFQTLERSFILMNGKKYYDRLFTMAGLHIGIAGRLYYRQIDTTVYLFVECIKREWVFWAENLTDSLYIRVKKYILIAKNKRVEVIARLVQGYVLNKIND